MSGFMASRRALYIVMFTALNLLPGSLLHASSSVSSIDQVTDNHRDSKPGPTRPSGRQAQLGIGLGLLAGSSPYLQFDRDDIRLIPVVTYFGERLRIFGLNVQWELSNSGPVRLALTGRYRFGAYDQDDSPLLQGMGDRESTLFAGVLLQLRLPQGIGIKLDYQVDALDRSDGDLASLFLNRKFKAGKLNFTPRIGLEYLSAEVSNYDFGVAENQATSTRPAYRPGTAKIPEIGMGLTMRFTKNWLSQIDVRYQWFDNEIEQSPIVGEDSVVRGFAALTYIFDR